MVSPEFRGLSFGSNLVGNALIGMATGGNCGSWDTMEKRGRNPYFLTNRFTWGYKSNHAKDFKSRS